MLREITVIAENIYSSLNADIIFFYFPTAWSQVRILKYQNWPSLVLTFFSLVAEERMLQEKLRDETY